MEGKECIKWNRQKATRMQILVWITYATMIMAHLSNFDNFRKAKNASAETKTAKMRMLFWITNGISKKNISFDVFVLSTEVFCIYCFSQITLYIKKQCRIYLLSKYTKEGKCLILELEGIIRRNR